MAIQWRAVTGATGWRLEINLCPLPTRRHLGSQTFVGRGQITRFRAIALGYTGAFAVTTHERKSPIRRVLCIIGLIGSILCSLIFAPRGIFPEDGYEMLALLNLIVATVCVSVLVLDARGPNVVANHGGIGILVGFCVGLTFLATKPGIVLCLLATIPGVVIGVIVGAFRSAMGESDAAQPPGNETVGNVDEAHVNDRPT